MNSDGRMFGWQRTRGGVRTPIMPVIIWDKVHGCSNHEFVGGLHVMKPEQYHLSLPELEKAYPAPEVQRDHQV